MLNNSQTLLDTSVAGPPPVLISDESGLIAGRYRLLRPLGEGGMGNVYLAEDLVLTRQVAVKTVRPELSGNEEVRSRIKRECRLHAAIGVHPNIVTLYDTVEENGHIYLVMEYFAGETLAVRLAATSGTQGLPLNRALDIVRQLLRALACIHGHDIVHRDIKTSNILLRLQPDGHYLAKLTDFGIAWAEVDADTITRLTSLGTQGPGTPVYMAPERIDPQTFGEVSPASDLYAVGIILFELLTGQPPFTGTMTEIFSGHLVQQPALKALPPTIPIWLHAVLHTALAKQPTERFQNAACFLTALAESEDNEAILPEHRTVQEATMLALHGDCPVLAPPRATVLNPAQACNQERLGLSRSHRTWLYAATVLILLLGGYLFQSQFAGKSKPAPSLPDVAAVTVTEPQPVTPTASELTNQVEPKDSSALEAVESGRQKKNIESMAAADRNESAPTNEWQVVENHSRKIR
jgi:eukaryotic-like serine/threonine-protein kinase